MSDITWAQLTADERRMLLDMGNYETALDVNNYGNADTKRGLESKGLVGRSFQHVWILDAGRAVLAQASDPQSDTGAAGDDSLDGFVALVQLYNDMKANPTDLEKRCKYFEALADGRLNDVYKFADERYAMQVSIVALRTRLAAAEAEAARLREALEPFARTYQVFSERKNLDITFIDWLRNHLSKEKQSAFARHARMWFMQAHEAAAPTDANEKAG